MCDEEDACTYILSELESMKLRLYKYSRKGRKSDVCCGWVECSFGTEECNFDVRAPEIEGFPDGGSQ